MQVSSIKNKEVLGKVLVPSLLINLLSLAVPLTVLQIYDRILPNQSYGTATLLIFGAFVVVSLEAIMRYVRSWLLAAAASNTEIATYKTLLEKVGYSSPSQRKTLTVGGVEEGLNSVNRVKEWYSGGIIAGFIDLPFVFIFLFMVAYISGELVLIPIVVWCMTLGFVWFSSSKARNFGQQASENEQSRKGFLLLLSQTLLGIKRQAIESRIFSQFKSLNYKSFLSKSKEEEQNAFAQECIQLASMGTSVVIVIVGSLWVLDGDLTTGGLAACSILSGRAVAPLSALIGIKIRLNTMHSAGQAISKLENLTVQKTAEGKIHELTSIEVKNLTAERYGVIHQLSFSAQKGEIILISSEERHTDSFFLSILAGMDDSVSGDVTFNKDTLLDVSNLRTHTSYCGVKGQLVDGTLLDNLCSFNPEYTAKANQYASALGVSNEITRLTDGLETRVGNTASSPLSMGGIKMLNIAAQLAKPTPILILDKPDASLDLDSLGRLTQVLKEEAQSGRVIFLVSYFKPLCDLATQVINVKRCADKE